ncbi:heme ABC transporter ATP-binding protein [Photobacterium sanctipauli]|uniref:Heme ABC transporter ATP-binding protein n=1 Tax=Photobacterium sanctipauli TaxID=1342794 RepID=A0A2T3NYG3_9GAMM|nr:heme ABC transporter ATP-binding protein [Photobacterium sanctipauli]PSW21317.1 heme ABC transporter ATP-binding protein [Photobacterium sanctipauli]
MTASTTQQTDFEYAIEASGLNLRLGNKVLLDDLAIQIKSGELTALLGPNGAGKSTLLKVLCGEQSATGHVSFFNQARDNWPAGELAKHLGVLPQHSNLTFAFTAQEVVELGALPLTLPNKQTTSIANEKMSLVDVTSLSNRLYPTLSGGEKQRVHFARVLTQLSLAGEQCILMLDEPTSALDLAHQHKTLQVAKAMAKAGAAVIIVIHDLNLAAQYADRLVILNEGKIQADGSPAQALTAETIERVYGWPVCITQHPIDHYPIVLPAANHQTVELSMGA